MAFDIIKAPKALALKDKVSNLRYELKHRDSLCLIFYKNKSIRIASISEKSVFHERSIRRKLF